MLAFSNDFVQKEFKIAYGINAVQSELKIKNSSHASVIFFRGQCAGTWAFLKAPKKFLKGWELTLTSFTTPGPPMIKGGRNEVRGVLRQTLRKGEATGMGLPSITNPDRSTL